MPQGPLVQITSSSFPRADRFAYWADVVTQTFVPLECDTPDQPNFCGDIRHRQIGLIGIAEVSASAMRARRTPATIARAPSDDLIAVLHLSGTCRTGQRSATAELAAGDGAVVATDDCYFFEFPGSFRQIVLKLPKCLLAEGPVDRESRRALVFAPGPARLLQKLAISSLEDPDEFSRDEEIGIERAFSELLRAASVPSGPDEGGREASPHYAHACLFIRQHLADPALRPAVVSAQLKISTRSLARLFARHGTTIERAIWTERLAAARRDLLDPRLVDRSITDIAFSWAFNDAAHFSRSFSKTYGVAPSDLRIAHSRPLLRPRR